MAAQFLRGLSSRLRGGGTQAGALVICPPMPVGPQGAYGGLTDGDALDIANYIKSLPPAVNFIADMCTFPPLPPSDGGTSDVGADTSD